MIRRWVFVVLAGLIPAVFAAAFLSMAWIRSHQGHSGEVYLSEIESLAIRREPADPLADALARGKKTYRHYCQVCHGAERDGGKEGDGHGDNSDPLYDTLEIRPQDFTDPEFWNRKETTEDRLRDAVSEGGPINGKSVLMPAWGHTLTDRQIRDVIAFVRSLGGQPTASAAPSSAPQAEAP